MPHDSRQAMAHLIGEVSARGVLCGMSKSAPRGSDARRTSSSLNSIAVALPTLLHAVYPCFTDGII